MPPLARFTPTWVLPLIILLAGSSTLWAQDPIVPDIEVPSFHKYDPPSTLVVPRAQGHPREVSVHRRAQPPVADANSGSRGAD